MNLDPVFCTYIVNYYARNAKRHAERWERLGFYIRAEECLEQVKDLYDVKAHALNDLLQAGILWPVDHPDQHFSPALMVAGYSRVRNSPIGFHLSRRKIWVPLPPAQPRIAKGCLIMPPKWPPAYSLERATEYLLSLS